MNEEFLIHMCRMQSDIFNVPCYIYKDKKRIFEQEPLSVGVDVVVPFIDELWESDEICNYILDEHMVMIGSVKIQNTSYRMVLGPVAMQRFKDKEVLENVFKYHKYIDMEYVTKLVRFFKTSQNYGISKFLQILASLASALNKKVFTVEGISKVRNDELDDIFQRYIPEIHHDFINKWQVNERYFQYTSFYIQHGMLQELKRFNEYNYPSTEGHYGMNLIRRTKNLSIIQVHIAKRSGIVGGLDRELCEHLEEIYIQKVEECQNIEELRHLLNNIKEDFCQRVYKLNAISAKSKAVKTAVHYISNHCTNALSLQSVAKTIGVSKEYLSKQFHVETGMSITEYIKKEKILFAKKMLACTDATLSEISEMLSFSSQSYFQNVFKQIEGCTPAKYREECKKMV